VRHASPAVLFDCIEFNERFRCADVAAEVAFLAMDLDHLGRADMGQAFGDSYVRRSGDAALLTLLHFYKCYRAFVRAKVLDFRLDDPRLGAPEAERIAHEARAYFDLAYAHTGQFTPPVLVVSMRLRASGKTTLAHVLAGRLGLVHLSSDVVRKRLAGSRPTTHRLDGFERGLYSRSMSRRVYAAVRRIAARWLRSGQSVVLDALHGQPAERFALRQLARRSSAGLQVILCWTDASVLQARLAARALDPGSTSDARLELWPALKAAFMEPTELSGVVTADTSQPLEGVVDDALAVLRASSAASTPAARSPA
jgi:predicted kinase